MRGLWKEVINPRKVLFLTNILTKNLGIDENKNIDDIPEVRYAKARIKVTSTTDLSRNT